MLLKPTEVVVLVWLATRPKRPWQGTVRDLAAALNIVPSQIQYSLNRAERCHLYQRASGRVLTANLLEFLEHGLRFALPAEPGPLDQGVPTAHSAPVMAEVLVASGEPALSRLVWPSLEGGAVGQTLAALHPCVPNISRVDKEFYAAMALIDSLRVGGVRERTAAASLLRERLQPC